VKILKAEQKMQQLLALYQVLLDMEVKSFSNMFLQKFLAFLEVYLENLQNNQLIHPEEVQ